MRQRSYRRQYRRSALAFGLLFLSSFFCGVVTAQNNSRCKRLYGIQPECNGNNGCKKCAFGDSYTGDFTYKCLPIDDQDNCCRAAINERACKKNGANVCVWKWNNARTRGTCGPKTAAKPAEAVEEGSRQDCRSRAENKCNGKCELSSNGKRCRPKRENGGNTGGTNDSLYRVGSRKYCKYGPFKPTTAAASVGILERTSCLKLTGCNWDMKEVKCKMESRVNNPTEGTEKWCALFDTQQQCQGQASKGCEYAEINGKGRMGCRVKRSNAAAAQEPQCNQLGDPDECNFAPNCAWRGTRNNGNVLPVEQQKCVKN